jgi:hypothetical protein
MAPKDVTDGSVKMSKQTRTPAEHKYSIGQRVRIALEKTTFSRGYTPNWSREVFIIDQQLQTDPPTYKIKDDGGEVILGSYYEPELQAV